MIIIAFFVFGLIIGSFLNVLVYRLKDAETLLGRSFCRHCKNKIRFYDNIPLVSFILLRGACRDCGKSISWQYPLLEFVTGVLFTIVGYFYFVPTQMFSWVETAWLLSVFSCFLAIGTYDLRHMEIPTSLILVSASLTIVFLLTSLFLVPDSFLSSRAWYGLLGGGVVGGFFFILVWVSKETWMGWGDVWLGLVAGLTVGLPLALPMLTLSFGLGAIVGIGAMLSKRKTMKSQIPFAPFLVAGVILILFLPKIFPFMQYLIL